MAGLEGGGAETWQVCYPCYSRCRKSPSPLLFFCDFSCLFVALPLFLHARWMSRVVEAQHVLFDVICVLCYMDCVKTISLTDSAYQRLLSWKNGGTFSEVVERLVPCKGTVNAVLEASQVLPDLSDADFDDLESMVDSTRKNLSSTWS